MAQHMTYLQVQRNMDGLKDVPQADFGPNCSAARGHNFTAPTTDLWGAATYIERDGAKRVSSLAANRLGVTLFHGPAGPGCYSFTVRNEDIPKLDAARDRAYAKFASPAK